MHNQSLKQSDLPPWASRHWMSLQDRVYFVHFLDLWASHIALDTVLLKGYLQRKLQVSPTHSAGFVGLNCHLACARTPRWCFNQNKRKFDSRRGTRTTLKSMTKPLPTGSVQGTVTWCTAKSEWCCKSKFGALSANEHCILMHLM